jgi:hypothetical protein
VDYRFSKERLRGESYPLKRDDLDAILESAPEGLVAEVVYRRATAALKQGMEVGPHFPTVRAHYVGVEDSWPYRNLAPGGVVITVRSVSSRERNAAEALLRLASGRLVEWLSAIAHRTSTWRSEPHQFDLFFADGAVGEREDGESRYPVSAA